MTIERLRIGMLSGGIGVAPLLVVTLLSAINLLATNAAIATITLVFPVSLLAAGIAAGYQAGRRRRRRSEVKAAIGATVGAVAGAVYIGGIAAVFLLRLVTTPANQRDFILSTHPIRILFALFLLATVISIVAMITTHMTALPLPPKGRTQELFAVRPPLKQTTLPPRPSTPIR